MLKLNQLKDNYGSKRNSKALGRGIGSGKGKTSGRGGKGQTARSGVAIKHWEGGQMPLFRRLPKRGFKNYTRVEYEVINVGQLQHLVNKGILNSGDVVTCEMLSLYGLYHAKKPLKLLGEGQLTVALQIEVNGASQTAVDIVQARGGIVSIIK